ncbi:MAG: LysM peptidoglycan-binding domain-containing protein [Treponema sp.]|jgi:hypothetical protein|nr:LysM peptidoglycan-binding domain-containing protein [Treponema sp.]
MALTIGIKIANGDFYPILEEERVVKKRLILTTAHNNQEIVHIELYKSATKTLADAWYLGRIEIKPIKPAPQGEPSIQLELASNPQGEIIANAVNLDPSSAHESRSLRVNPAYTREQELSERDPEPAGMPPHGLYETESERKRVPWLLLGLIGLLPILLGLIFFLFKGNTPLYLLGFSPVTPAIVNPQPPADLPPGTGEVSGDRSFSPEKPHAPAALEGGAPVPQRASPSSTETAEPRWAPAAPVPVIEAPVRAPAQELSPNRNRPAPPVASYKVPATIPRGGVSYRIRWGDTLWDISEAFYRNPWLYTRIARFNNIRRPDLIVAGRTIRIPPRN